MIPHRLLRPAFRLLVTTSLSLALLVAAADLAPLFQQGKDFEAQKKYDEAVAAYTQALDLEPNNTTALSLRAVARNRTGDRAGALADLDRCLAIDPAYDGARYQRSLVHATLKNFDAALADLDELIRHDPKNARYHYDRARACRLVGRTAEAMQSAEEMLRLAPDNVNSWALRSMLREKSGDAAGALADIQKALALAKDEKSVAMYTKDRDRLQPLAAAAAQPATPQSAATPPPTAAPTAAPGPATPDAAPAFARLDLRELSAVQYNGAISVAMEGLRAVYAPMSAANTAKFEAQWAPLFHHPSAAAVAYLNNLIPLVQEFLSLRSLLGESAAAYDRAIEESRFAAGFGSDAGVAAAMSEAGRCKAVIEDRRTSLQSLVTKIGALGDPPDPAAEQKRQRKRHTDALRTARRAAGLAGEAAFVRVEFPDLPEGWVVQYPRLRNPGARGPSLRGPATAKPEPAPAALADYRFRPPADERFAYLDSFGGLNCSYQGADLLSLAEIRVSIDRIERPITDLDTAIRVSVLRDHFFPPETPWAPDYVERLARLPKPRALETTFNGTPAYLIEGHHFDAPINGGHMGFTRVIFIQPDEAEPNLNLRIEARVTCPYDRLFDIPTDAGMDAAVAARKAACAARIESRLQGLFSSLFITSVSEIPDDEFARNNALVPFAHANAIGWAFYEPYPESFQPWSRGRWQRWQEMFYQGARGLPKEQRPPRPPALNDTAMRVTPDDGKTVFQHTWSLLPDSIPPGPFALDLNSSNTAHTTDRDGDIIDYTARLRIWAFGAETETATVHADPKRGPQRTSARLSTVVPTGKEAHDVSSIIVEITDHPHDTSVEMIYQWIWDLPPDNPSIPEFFLLNRATANAPPPPTAEDLKRAEAEKKAKQERIAEIRENIGFLEKCLAAERAELERAGDPQRRADYQFRIIGLESDILAEQDLIKSLETGTIVHTRSPFEQYAAATFEQQCRAEAQAASLTLRAVESANRLAALLPPEEAAQAREFLARQFTPKVLAEHDVAKVREIVGAVANKVQGHWQGEAAKGELAAANAQFGMDAATNIKTAADYSMSACTLFGGGSINLLYQAGTGYAEGGFKQAAKNALTTWSDAADYAFTAYDAYQESGGQGAASALILKYAQGKTTQYFAGKLMGDASPTGSSGGDAASPAHRKPTLQEQFDAAKFKQEREWGEALVKDFQKTQSNLMKAGSGDAAPDIILKLQAAARDKAAAVASSLHAKNYLKYVADAGTGRAYDAHMGAVHAESDALLKQRMAAAGWNAEEWDLVEFRNAASLGKPNMDRDVGLRERGLWKLSENGLPMKGVRNPDAWTVGPNGRPMPKPQLTKDGRPMSLDQWREEAQKYYNQAYRKASGGRSAEVAMEGITTSTHPEAYKDVLWLGDDKTLVSGAWAAQAGDVTRYKANHLLTKGDPSVAYFTKLQEVSRGTAKDLDTKLLPLLAAAKSSAGSADALKFARGHWAEVQKTLQAFGRNDLDPITATRRIRELTGGKSIPEVVDEMATLLESLAKRGGR